MPESDELNAAIGHIKYKVDSMDRTLERLLRVNGKAMIADYMEQFAADPILEKVYLSVDGYKTQKAIGEDTGYSPAVITNRIKTLVDLDLIELLRVTKEGKIYQYTKMESIFKISRNLIKETAKCEI